MTVGLPNVVDSFVDTILVRTAGVDLLRLTAATEPLCSSGVSDFRARAVSPDCFGEPASLGVTDVINVSGNGVVQLWVMQVSRPSWPSSSSVAVLLDGARLSIGRE